MAKNINPFVTSGYKGPQYFCDRVQETERLKSSLRNGNNVTLISPRRIGKTGLIKHTFHQMQAEDKDAQFFYVDILPTKSLAQLVQALAQAIAGKMDSKVEKVKQWALNFIKGFRPTMSFDTITGAPEFSFDIQPTEARTNLESILDYLENSGHQCYVAIDEFQQILNYDDQGTEALIRSKVQFMRHVNFIFSGSQMHLMTEMFLSPQHPFFHSTSILTIKEIKPLTFRDFANDFFAQQGHNISESDFNYLYDLVDGQTWYVQKILSNLYRDGGIIDTDAVKSAVQEAIEEQESTFQYLAYNLTPNQLAIVRAIAREHLVAEPYAAAFLHRYHLPAASSVKRTLQTLEKQQILYHDLQRGYLVYDRFFALWLRRLG